MKMISKIISKSVQKCVMVSLEKIAKYLKISYPVQWDRDREACDE